MRKINIKNVSVGQLICFGEHYHTVLDKEIDCSNMYGTVMQAKELKNWNLEIIINLHNAKYQSDLEEFQTDFGPNNLIFNFPDDDHYNDVEVTVLTKEEVVTYHAIIGIEGGFRAEVKATSKAEALEMFHNGDFESDDMFSLADCQSLEHDVAYDDIEDEDEYVYERGVTK